MTPSVINFAQKLDLISEHWSPKNVAQLNDYHFKLVKLEGDFIWHSHADTDEAFVVVKGVLHIDFRDRRETIHAGEMLVVPKGVEHKPFAPEECHLLLIEPAGIPNTGDEENDEREAAQDEWI